jgi:hypothetical protein
VLLREALIHVRFEWDNMGLVTVSRAKPYGDTQSIVRVIGDSYGSERAQRATTRDGRSNSRMG